MQRNAEFFNLPLLTLAASLPLFPLPLLRLGPGVAVHEYLMGIIAMWMHLQEEVYEATGLLAPP